MGPPDPDSHAGTRQESVAGSVPVDNLADLEPVRKQPSQAGEVLYAATGLSDADRGVSCQVSPAPGFAGRVSCWRRGRRTSATSVGVGRIGSGHPPRSVASDRGSTHRPFQVEVASDQESLEAPPTKFVLASYGSRGDIEPCAVGLELLRREARSAHSGPSPKVEPAQALNL